MRQLILAAVPMVLAAGVQAQLVVAPAGGLPPVVQVRSAAGTVSFMAYDEAFRGGVQVATGDMDGDGATDIITGAGPGGGPHVKVFRGTDRSLVRSFTPFGASYQGGTSVAVGVLMGDRSPDVIVSPDRRTPDGGPHIRVFDGVTGWHLYSIDPFPGFGGGVRVAAADLDGDGYDDVIAVPDRTYPELRLKVYCGRTMIELENVIISNYSLSGHGDASVAGIGADFAAGRHSGTILVGLGDGSVRFIKDSIETGTWYPFGAGYTGGVNVGAGDVNGDGRLEVVAGMARGGRITSVPVDPSDPAVQGFDPFGADFTGGVFVGAAQRPSRCGGADINRDGDIGTDADIEAFFACLAGSCCPRCGTADFDRDGDTGTDADIEAFFRVLGGGGC